MVKSKIIDFGTLENKISSLKTQEERIKFFSSIELKKELEERVSLVGRDVECVTLDIFDTLLLRNEESELSKFYRIAQKQEKKLKDELSVECSADDLMLARISATRTCYKARPALAGCREGSIDLIYKIASRTLGFESSDIVEFLVSCELEVECDSLLLNSGLVDAVRFLWPEAKLGLISDMYLHSSQLEYILNRFDFVNYDFMYSSADTIVSKHSALIFDYVAKNEKLNFNNWVHLGDAIVGDFQSPQNKGIVGVHLPIPEFIVEKRKICETDFKNRARSRTFIDQLS